MDVVCVFASHDSSPLPSSSSSSSSLSCGASGFSDEICFRFFFSPAPLVGRLRNEEDIRRR